MIKRCIFTYCNFQVEDRIRKLQKAVIDKFNTLENCNYEFLFYNAKDGDVVPNQVINYGLDNLFYKNNYNSILILDIDCIPTNINSFKYTFDQAETGKIVGNIQRSNHLNNGKHVYVAPSAMCFTKETYEKLGKPSFDCTFRSDIGEELCYIAEENSVELEMFLPKDYQKLPYGESKPWDLKDDMPKYGIGTTFVNKNGDEMFYHLFQSRINIFNDLFFLKCAELLL